MWWDAVYPTLFSLCKSIRRRLQPAVVNMHLFQDGGARFEEQ